jgi:hypothetical protein
VCHYVFEDSCRPADRRPGKNKGFLKSGQKGCLYRLNMG